MTKTKAYMEGRIPKIYDDQLPALMTGQGQIRALNHSFNPYEAATELADVMNSSSRSMFGNWMQKNRANIASSKLRAITSFVNDYIEYNDAVTNARYRMAINHITLQRMIEGRLEQMEMEAKKFFAEHERALDKLKHEERMEKLAEDSQKAATEKIRADIKIAEMLAVAQVAAIMAKASIDKAKAKREESIANMIDSIVAAGIDLEKATVMATSIYNTILGAKGEVDVDAVVNEQMADAVKEKLDEEIRIMRTKREREEAETRKRKHDIEVEIGDDEGTTGGPIHSRKAAS